MSGTTSPTAIVAPLRSERASRLGWKRSRSATSHTRCRVLALTSGLSASAREAVACETPASAATSASVGAALRRVAMPGDNRI